MYDGELHDSNSSDNFMHKNHLPKNPKRNDATTSTFTQQSYSHSSSGNSGGTSHSRRNDSYDGNKHRDSKPDERNSRSERVSPKEDKHKSRERDRDRDRVERADRSEKNRDRSGRDKVDKDRDRDKYRRDRRDEHDRERRDNYDRERRDEPDRDRMNKSSADTRRDRNSEKPRDRKPSPNDRKRRSRSRDNKERKRSRSRSRDRSYKSSYPMTRLERDQNKAEQLKKMGIDYGATNANITVTNFTTTGSRTVTESIPNDHTHLGSTAGHNMNTNITAINKPPPINVASIPALAEVDLSNFTAPILISPRYTEQMQKRKLLWSGKKAEASKSAAPTTTNKWEMTKFSQDTDGKVASKFLRLMGMKDAPKPPENVDNAHPDVIKKQNEMFSTMEHQYEVARQVTHTMRGMGLGFGSQRQF